MPAGDSEAGAGEGRAPSNDRVSILFADDRMVVVDKPSGISVHRGWDGDDDTLVMRVRRRLGDPGVSPIHRLDRGTSGVVVFARSAEAARSLQRQLTQEDDSEGSGGARKRYVALVRGAPPERGAIDSPIPRRDGGPRVPARTGFETRSTVVFGASDLREKRYSLVIAEPATGRLHQVRRHLKHLGHPVIGDANYGRLEHNRLLRDAVGLARLALHAARLDLIHPATGVPLSFVAAMPADLVEPLARMGFAPGDWEDPRA